MLPVLWRCGGNLWLDWGGLPLHPAGLLLLVGAWGLLAACQRARGGSLALGLAKLLLAQTLVLAALQLFVAGLSRLLRWDPTPVLHGLQYVAVAIAWASIGWQIRRFRSQPPSTAAPVGKRPPRAPLAVALLSLAAAALVLTPPFIGKGTALYPLTLPRWALEMVALPLATDECLARRAIDRFPPPLLGRPLWGDAERGPDGLPVTTLPDPAGRATGVLRTRGPSAADSVAAALERVLARGDREEERRAFRFLSSLARWNLAHPTLDAWARAPTRPHGHELIAAWRECVKLERPEFVGFEVSGSCEPPPRKSAASEQ